MTPESRPDLTQWRTALPLLAADTVVLREPDANDAAALLDLLSIADASRFGLELPISHDSVLDLIDRLQRERKAGVGFAYAMVARPADAPVDAARAVVGLFRVRQLDPGFEAAEWECTLVPSARGTGVFGAAARLVGGLVFDAIGAHRLEARALLQNGRANGALRKLGAVQEGILRRAVFRGGEYQDQVLWSLLKEDWTDHWVPSSPRVH